MVSSKPRRGMAPTGRLGGASGGGGLCKSRRISIGEEVGRAQHRRRQNGGRTRGPGEDVRNVDGAEAPLKIAHEKDYTP